MKKKKTWIAIGVIVVLSVLVGANVWRGTAENLVEVEVTQLEEEPITETVMTPGQLKLADQQTIYYTPEKGEVGEILVQEGDEIENGTPLIRYENNQLELDQEQNDLQLQSANLQVNELQQQHEDIDEMLEDDEENEQLQAEHDQIKLQEQQATIEAEQLRLQKESIQQQINDLEVTSDISGKVVEVNEQAMAGLSQMDQQQPLIRIGTLDQMIVEGVISEYDTLKIEEGQPVTLSSDAVPDQTWEGEVSFISDLPNETESMNADGGTAGVQYPVEITVDAEDMNLKPGFQMVVVIVTDEYNANTLPITAVQQDGDTNYVYIVNNQTAQRQEVEVGSVSNETIEITDGLTNEDQIIIDPADTVQEGMDVSIQ